ncbi:Trm112 family protein [Cricetibacter osteomyelitidis]|uniref:Trm112 family protein n=1 Tax=Cricetibacter osteomyelitidis TaxID=1521931 RepID=UPI001046DF3B|nr:Trm112 family protein [Cricetibacter osteomyelitidis]
MNPKLLEIVACPLCQGRLKYDKENDRLICNFDHVAYPIELGVPVLLAERAVTIYEQEK